jgi:hypothetical protein
MSIHNGKHKYALANKKRSSLKRHHYVRDGGTFKTMQELKTKPDSRGAVE